MKRLAVYFFYDSDGIVDDYVSFFLDDLCCNIDQLYIVCNGSVNEQGIRKLQCFTPNVKIRPNSGFDVWAYKETLEQFGFEYLAGFDELLLVNATIFGPLFPFREMFSRMDQCDVDFWGITTYNHTPENPYRRKNGYSYIPTHIQSHFIAVRNRMFCSEEFADYWREMPPINSYEDSVAKHEMLFTKHFADLGYKWKSYVGTEQMQACCAYPLLLNPLELARERRCPIIKRRSFFHDYAELVHYTNGQAAAELLEYIEQHLSYDCNMIWDNILRTCNQAAVKRCLHLNYILPVAARLSPDHPSPLKAALMLHIYYDDLIPYCQKYAESMPEDADIYITTDTAAKKEKIEKQFATGPFRHVQVIQIGNRGRDVSALLVGCAPYLERYDLVCFAHDKKVAQMEWQIVGESYSYRCFENLLKNKVFVENVFYTFAANPRLGLLTPPPPNFSSYYGTAGGYDWGCNFDRTIELANQLGIRVPIDLKDEPVAPFGTMFWFRPASLRPLFRRQWAYEDFPPEPNDVDGTMLHALERLYPFAVQQEGFYPAWVLADSFAKVEITNYHYFLRELNRRLLPIYHPNDFHQLIEQLSGHHGIMRILLKSFLPGKVYEKLRQFKHRIKSRK